MDVQFGVGSIEDRPHLAHDESGVCVSLRLVVDRRGVSLFFDLWHARFDARKLTLKRHKPKPEISAIIIFDGGNHEAI